MTKRINGETGLVLAADKLAHEQAGKVTLDDQIDEVARWISQCGQAKADMARRGQLEQVARVIEPALARQRAILQTLSMVRSGVTGAPAQFLQGLTEQTIIVIFRALVDKYGAFDMDGGAALELEGELFRDRTEVFVEWRITETGGFKIRIRPPEPGTPPASIPEVQA